MAVDWSQLVPEGRVLRLAASMTWLPRADCAVPERCEDRRCEVCRTVVHYDPKASIPLLGPEFIVCNACVDAFLMRTVGGPSNYLDLDDYGE